MPTITYSSSDPAPGARAAIAYLLDAAGVPARPADPGEAATLVHGDIAMAEGGLRIPIGPGDRTWPELAAGEVDHREIGETLPVDLVALVRAHLDDAVHDSLPAESFDLYGRLNRDASFSATAGIAHVPIVNRAVVLLSTLATERFKITPHPAWPGGRRAAVGLSHDVDLPERYAMAGDLLRPWRFRHAPRTQMLAALRLARERLVDRSPDDHWAFDELLAAEEKLGLRSTFLFSVTPYHARFGSTLDPAYDASGPRYRRLYERLRSGGWEIGLHASYRAHEDPLRLVAERHRLGDLAGGEIAGLRHHYWQLGPDVAATLRAHEAAGFAYDASLAFNDAPGYRRGAALPFHPYDAEMQRPLTTLQLPTTLMDGNLFYRPTGVEAAITAATDQVEAIADLGGLAVIDWHAHTSVSSNRRFQDWGSAYEGILTWLGSRSDLWVTTLGEITQWRERRSAELRAAAATG